MSIFSSTQIIINPLNISPLQRYKKTALASSPILDTLLPELSVWQTGEVRHKQQLENIDAYMLEETRLILKRVHLICFKLGLAHSTDFNIKLQASGTSAVLLVTGTFAEKETLTKRLNQDNWLTGAFNWLCPNYSALAHSQELKTFSYAYEKNRHQALYQYRHFAQTEQGMRCYLACNIEQGEPKLTLRLESPKTIYILQELQNYRTTFTQ